MENRVKKSLITLIAVTLVLVILVVITVGLPKAFVEMADSGLDLSFLDGNDAARRNAMLFGRGELTVYPENFQKTVAIGEYIYFTVERDGELLTYKDLTYEIVEGRDCAAVYFSGGLRALGEGVVTVKAYLDVDSGVYGYGTIRVIEEKEPNDYTEKRANVSGSPKGDAKFEESISGFPESYKPHLRALHTEYPSWEFRPFFTGLDFFDAVYNEGLYDRNVTPILNMADLIKRKGAGDYNRETGQYILKDTGWVSVNNIAVSHFMDPRNFLDKKNIFQFELLTYDESFHSAEGVEGILKGSFMYGSDTSYVDSNGDRIISKKTYAEVIFEAGRQAGISPYFLASKIKQEIGSTPSRAATGTCPGYEGLYNFYNIGATDGEGNVERGLAWAGSGESFGRPWTSPERSIMGGAQVIAGDYVNAGQFTGYLQKFNVNPEASYGLYSHQYMTNVSGAVSQGFSVYSGYSEVDLLQSKIIFSIPVFDNMPGASRGTASEISLGGETSGTVSRNIMLRKGPADFYEAVDGLMVDAGEVVKVKRAVMTDATYYQNRLFNPVWYEVEVFRGEQTYTGYVSEDYVARAAARVLDVGESFSLSCTVMPQSCDDVVRYLSENSEVASVSSNGEVTANGSGIVIIVAYTSGGAADCVTIIVK